jgi:hypothetical protein
MRILFLDIDGVLNGHDYDPLAESCTIRTHCITNLSKILTQTDVKVVISSAWRYMISRGAMTLRGFEYLLRTHRLAGIQNRIIGITREDLDQTSKTERGLEIEEWLRDHPEVTHYLVIDDMDYGISIRGHPFLQTDGTVGLTEADADKAIMMLRGPLTQRVK